MRHRGASFLEILQNCQFSMRRVHRRRDRRRKRTISLILEHGKPLGFGKNRGPGIG